jgi:toxin CcdB
MAQFDVYPNPIAADQEGFPCLLDVQSDLLAHLSLRVVVPLVRADVADPPLPRLNPRFVIDGTSLVMATTLIGGLPTHILREPIINLGDYRTEIIGAIDMLITGV